MPKGIPFKDPPLRHRNADKLVDQVAQAALAGGGLGLRKSHLLEGVTERDRRVLQRMVGLTVEEFNQKLIGKLDKLADMIVDRMTETVDETPLQSLGFNLAVAIDKRQRLAGQAMTANSSVNIQVNNFGNMSKEEILAKLTGKMEIAQPEEPPLELAGGETPVGVDVVDSPEQQKAAIKAAVRG